MASLVRMAADLAIALNALADLRAKARPEIVPYIDDKIEEGITLESNLQAGANAKSYLERDNELGFLPLVPALWAGGAAVVGAVTAYLASAYKTVQGAQQVEVLVDKGVPAEKAAELVYADQSSKAGWAKILIPIGIGAGIIWLLKKKSV